MVYYRTNSYNSDMFLVGILSWWYGNGWLSRARILKDRLRASADFFSIGLLVSTIFAPYRQISVGNVGNSLNDRIRAFFDRLLSRIIGAFARTFMILFGSIAMLLQIIFGVIVLVFWLIIPLLPVAGLIAMAIGLVPQWGN